MTAMPAGRLAVLPAVLATALLSGCVDRDDAPPHRINGTQEAGRAAIARIGCGACHVIPGVPGARGQVGPSLAGFGVRRYIAGIVPNHPTVLIRWVRAAPEIAPDTAMPALPLSDQEARDIAAFLYTLR